MEPYVQAILTLMFLTGMMWGMVKFLFRDIHRDLQDIRSDIQEIKDEQRVARVRTDHLYEIVCKLVKEDKRA